MDYRSWSLERKRAYAEQVRSRNRDMYCDCSACQRERQNDLISRVTRLTKNWSGNAHTAAHD